ncbi:MAG: aspartate aminotransferase family protein [Candidatus Omnitrophica bacterium]|nr:aspartate aminotransferase family protein [Candidatus Omnitrophota bacterium]
MKTKEIAKLYDRYAIPVYNRLGIAARKGSGSWLWDYEGRRYLDLFPGWGVGAIGHCHPHVIRTVTAQMKKLMHVPNTFYHEPQARLARMLVTSAFPGKIFLCSTGAEAVEGAIKLARRVGYPKRYEIITMKQSFHGRTMGALAATGQTKHSKWFRPMLSGFRHVPFNDIRAVRRAIGPKTVAVMVELVQGEGGIHVASKKYIRQLKELCRRKGLLLIFDEISTGGGRTGTLFCYQQYGVTPDILLLAKGIGGGLNLGIILAGRHISDVWEKASHATTFGGNPVAAAAGIATLEVIRREKLLQNVRKQGAYFMKRLAELKKEIPAIREIRGMGLMIGIQMDRPGAPVVQACLRRGLLINCSQQTVLRIYPAMNVTRKQIDLGLKILKQAFEEALGQK